MATIDRVLVIKVGPVRDFILALPAMTQIRAAHPRATVTLLTVPAFESFAKASGCFNAVESMIEPGKGTGWLAAGGRVRAGRYQRIYDLEGHGGTNLLFQTLRPFPPAWSGVAVGCSLPHRNVRRAAMHPLERRAEQLQAAGIWPEAPTEPGSAPEPDLAFLAAKAADARATTQSRPTVVLAPGGLEPALLWPVERYAELAALLTAQGYDIVVAGSPQDAPLARGIQRLAPRVRDLTGRGDLLALASLTARAHLVVGSDPDIMQVAAAASIGAIMPLPTRIDPATVAPRGHVTVVNAANLADLTPQTILQVAPAVLPQRP